MLVWLTLVCALKPNQEYKMFGSEAPIRYLTLQEGLVRLTKPSIISQKEPYMTNKFKISVEDDLLINDDTPVQIIFAPDQHLCRNSAETSNIMACSQASDLSTWRLKKIEQDTYNIMQDGKCLFIDKFDSEMDGYHLELFDCSKDDLKTLFKIVPVHKDTNISDIDLAGAEIEFRPKRKRKENKEYSDRLFNVTFMGGNFSAGDKNELTKDTKITIGFPGAGRRIKDLDNPLVRLLKRKYN
ncbi:hypothetical protein COBT_000114 [Conglomerata obtusa]